MDFVLIRKDRYLV